MVWISSADNVLFQIATSSIEPLKNSPSASLYILAPILKGCPVNESALFPVPLDHPHGLLTPLTYILRDEPVPEVYVTARCVHELEGINDSHKSSVSHR